MRIETERLIVRSFCEEDGPALYAIKMDPQMLEYIPDFLKRGAQIEEMKDYIRDFNRLEEAGDISGWRCYAIERKEDGAVVGCISFGKSGLLFEYELGWMMNGAYSGNGYASEAAEAFAEYICGKHGLDYLIVIMDVDNPASFRTAEKSGFKLFEKRTVYDGHCGKYFDDYYYFRRYYSGCTLQEKFYGDVPYTGR